MGVVSLRFHFCTIYLRRDDLYVFLPLLTFTYYTVFLPICQSDEEY